MRISRRKLLPKKIVKKMNDLQATEEGRYEWQVESRNYKTYTKYDKAAFRNRVKKRRKKKKLNKKTH